MRLCILFLCLLLVRVSAVRRLNNINDLKNVNYGRPAPRHGLQMLFWFSQRGNVDQNRFIINFNPVRGDFGFHYFGNRGPAILPNRNDLTYYSVGNLNHRRATELPDYVRRYSNDCSLESNMDRLIVSVDQNNPQRIHNVYITAHQRGRNSFDPDATYEIAPPLIQQLRADRRQVCTVNQNYNFAIFDGNTEDTEDEKCRKFLEDMQYNRRTKRSVDVRCDAVREMKLRATNNGSSKIIWKNMPAEEMETKSYIEIIQNSYSSGTPSVKFSEKLYESEGFESRTLETSVPLNGGLQLRLRLYTSYRAYFCYGPELDDANKVIPTRIKGFDASLQLYTKDGYACARLYIKKTFTNWKNDFDCSWVGFYTGNQMSSNKYSTYQYAVNFKKVEGDATEVYDIYTYQSSLAIAYGVQIRFLLDKTYNHELAQTTPWEGAKEVRISPLFLLDCDDPIDKYVSGPKLFYGAEFDDANRVMPTTIEGFDASLQLFTKDGKACARLYVKKTLSNWKNVNNFYNSWVGFYSSPTDFNNKYYTYNYAVNFDKVEGDNTEDYDVYTYHSSLWIADGVQIRFLCDKNYDCERARTKSWESV
nr:uncharacterized protein LOC129441401 [Misgurnus anguillicaudatus]